MESPFDIFTINQRNQDPYPFVSIKGIYLWATDDLIKENTGIYQFRFLQAFIAKQMLYYIINDTKMRHWAAICPYDMQMFCSTLFIGHILIFSLDTCNLCKVSQWQMLSYPAPHRNRLGKGQRSVHWHKHRISVSFVNVLMLRIHSVP